MKVELKKVNEPNGSFWYGLVVDGQWQIPGFGTDLEKAKSEYDKILEHAKNAQPREEIIYSETVDNAKEIQG